MIEIGRVISTRLSGLKNLNFVVHRRILLAGLMMTNFQLYGLFPDNFGLSPKR